MKKTPFLVFILLISMFSASVAKTDQQQEKSLLKDIINEEEVSISNETFTIKTIEIGVESMEIRIIDQEQNIKAFTAATATKSKVQELPFEKKGYVSKIVFNPRYFPTKKIKQEYTEKTGKQLPGVIQQGKQNPLGRIKIFIEYENGPNDLGIHGTNEPKSIGKRASHGCNRMRDNDLIEIASLLLSQNGYDTQEIIKKAKKYPNKALEYKIIDSPEVYYRKK